MRVVRYLNPTNWKKGVLEIVLAAIFLVSAIVHRHSVPIAESNEYLIFWILTSAAMIRVDIATAVERELDNA